MQPKFRCDECWDALDPDDCHLAVSGLGRVTFYAATGEYVCPACVEAAAEDFDPRAEWGTHHVRFGSVVG